MGRAVINPPGSVLRAVAASKFRYGPSSFGGQRDNVAAMKAMLGGGLIVFSFRLLSQKKLCVGNKVLMTLYYKFDAPFLYSAAIPKPI